MSTIEQLMQAALTAPEERRQAALRVLQGETTPVAKPVTGPLLMNINAAAKFLGVSRTTLWKIVAAGAVERLEVFPGSFWVTRASLEALAARSSALRPGSVQAISGQAGTIQFPLGKRGRPRKEATANS
jgi:hypothetical protein